jgi:hypothetical protein
MRDLMPNFDEDPGWLGCPEDFPVDLTSLYRLFMWLQQPKWGILAAEVDLVERAL